MNKAQGATMRNKITFEGERGFYNVCFNGKNVASICGSHGEYWVSAESNRKFIGRFKYCNSLTSAKHFIRWFLNAGITAEQAAEFAETKAPICWAEERGYIPYNILCTKKRLLKRGCTLPLNTVREIVDASMKESEKIRAEREAEKAAFAAAIKRIVA
jgi:hypothetical protein